MTTNYFETFDKQFKNRPEKDVETVLIEVANQIRDRYKDNGMDCIVTSSEASDSKNRVLNLNLFSLEGNNYSYRLITLKQPIDNEFPVEATAFLNPATKSEIWNSVTELQDWIIKDVVGNVRMRIVTD